MKKIVPGIYRHFKGNVYLVVDPPARDAEAEKPLWRVTYCPLYGDSACWTRTVQSFNETMHRPELKYKGPRFKLIKKI